MTNVVEFPQPTPDQPDAEHTCIIVKDGKPEKWLEFSGAFDDGGSEFAFEIWATSKEDAERRVQCIRQSARLGGQIFGTVPL
jgi:hypothetical protein